MAYDGGREGCRSVGRPRPAEREDEEKAHSDNDGRKPHRAMYALDEALQAYVGLCR